jgi:hypothetical protein
MFTNLEKKEIARRVRALLDTTAETSAGEEEGGTALRWRWKARG